MGYPVSYYQRSEQELEQEPFTTYHIMACGKFNYNGFLGRACFIA